MAHIALKFIGQIRHAPLRFESKTQKQNMILPHSQTSLAMDYEFSKYNPSTFSCIMILYAIPCLLDNLHWGFVWTMSLFHHCHWVPHQWCTHWGWSNIPRCLKWNYFYSRRFHHSDMTTTWKMEKKLMWVKHFWIVGKSLSKYQKWQDKNQIPKKNLEESQ